MIIDIKYSNIRVFRDETVFSMEASESMEKSENVICAELDGETIRALNVGMVYGANAAGKTTLIYTVYVLRDWVLNLQSDYFSDVIAPFAMNDYSPEEPSCLTIRFITGGYLYNYAVAFLKGKCCKETLTLEHKDCHEVLFERIAPKTGIHSVKYGPDIAKESPGLEVAPDKSILSLFNNIYIPRISEAAKYIASIEIANSYSPVMMKILFSQVRPWLNKNGNRKRLVDFENCFDINLKDIKIPQKPESSPAHIKYIHPITDKDGNFLKDSEFRSDLESSGTKVLTILGAKVLQALDEGRVLMVDEFDSGFHTEVTKTVIQMFRDPEINRKGAQLILTTHNVTLMEEHVFRKDQIWFIEKNDSGVSELFSLVEFEDVDEYTHFSEWYLAKRFGALPRPNLLRIRALFNHEK